MNKSILGFEDTDVRYFECLIGNTNLQYELRVFPIVMPVCITFKKFHYPFKQADYFDLDDMEKVLMQTIVKRLNDGEHLVQIEREINNV